MPPDLREASISDRGTGSRQYPPALMLGLLMYFSAIGTFVSRQIERTTYENVAVRLFCAAIHPDHDSICIFRRANYALLISNGGVSKMCSGWRLLNLVYNLKRLFHIGTAPLAA